MPKSTRAAGATNAAVQAVQDSEEPSPAAPALSASKAVWQAHAEALGAADDVLAGSKADIQAWVADNTPG